MFLLPLLLLCCAFFLGSVKVASATQARVSFQGRLDACAVRVAVGRERLFTRLAALNGFLDVNVKAITAARAAALVPGAGEAAMAAQTALLQANAALAGAEDASVAAASLEESARMRCAPTRYSGAPAACLATPPLAGVFDRKPTLFPDVKGTLEVRSGSRVLSSIRCFGAHLETKLAVRGDARLRGKDFQDAYLL